ncbi:beta-galactosidase [Leifsonia shinshuensis]|uniref:beta-galactosidase n=1 Tax=Leifsonia shinshuensis TaxID=150026 RepID=UPI002860B7BF|nr:beta-galactosidase [Leifsonia shinshuensis]MDR6972760.1 beta-galactosidase [Leifsonia shinshuensis]
MTLDTVRTALAGLTRNADDSGSRIVFGCDYNPEQWDRSVWAEDIRLMVESGVSLVAINVFGWAQVQPNPDEFDFSDLDAIIDMLHEAGIGVNLGTGTSSPPPWLTTLHPEILPVSQDGLRAWPGGRQAYCPSSPVFHAAAERLVTAVATRYGSHPAVRLWHVSNELGCHNALCYCDVSAEAFRGWLQRKYGTTDALNRAWGTAFWSQRYGDWSEVLPPRRTLSAGNPAQALDFARFSSDEVLNLYTIEERILRSLSDAPVTTNFMVTSHIRTQNYWEWAPHVDLVANDHYLDHRLPVPHQELSFAADGTRGLAGGHPWLLMEQSTGAVNWQPRNIAKEPGELVRNSLAHVARGADGICFFQWRASAQGTEKFHSALIPHAGTESHKWQEVLELSRTLHAIREVVGSEVVADVAMVFSWEAWWATDLDSHPSEEVRYLDQVHRMYRALWEAGITVDLVAPDADLSGYRMVVVPSLYLVRDHEAANLRDYVDAGGTAVISFFSGIVDEDDRVRLGGYPGAFTELLGIRTDEFFPLADGAERRLDNGATATIWTERIATTTATAVSTYQDGPLEGEPALTVNSFGSGRAWYLGTDLDHEHLRDLLHEAAIGAGASLPQDHVAGIETVLRRGPEADYHFFINHTRLPHTRIISGHELITDQPVTSLEVPAGAVRVVRTERTES